MTTAVRYRRHAGQHWRPGRLRRAMLGAPGVVVVELVDARTGAVRTLTNTGHQIQLRHRRRWLAATAWTKTTAELFPTT
jgi:hypothetical protein